MINRSEIVSFYEHDERYSGHTLYISLTEVPHAMAKDLTELHNLVQEYKGAIEIVSMELKKNKTSADYSYKYYALIRLMRS